MTATRGTALLHQHHLGWMPWAGEMPDARGGAMVSDRMGQSTGYALDKLQLSGQFFVAPGEQLYEGMVVGECAREDEMVVNAVRPKEKNNIRTHSHDDAVKLPAPRVHTLETAIERIKDDELVAGDLPEGHPHPQALPRPRGTAQGVQASSSTRAEGSAADGRVGQWRPSRPLQQGHQSVVHRLADHLDDLVAQRAVHRAGADEGVAGLRAPPVELVAARPPVALRFHFAQRVLVT